MLRWVLIMREWLGSLATTMIPFSVRTELVEVLPFSRRSKERQPFDKLRANGWGRDDRSIASEIYAPVKRPLAQRGKRCMLVRLRSPGGGVRCNAREA